MVNVNPKIFPVVPSILVPATGVNEPTVTAPNAGNTKPTAVATALPSDTARSCRVA